MDLSDATAFVPGLVLCYFAASLYLLPAFVLVNFVFGYQTIKGAPPLPMPATSVESLLIVLAAHAALVAMAHMAIHARRTHSPGGGCWRLEAG